MIIHNVVSDLMLALSTYLNSFISPKIKNFQYNFANTSFVLNLDPQFELPAAIIKLDGLEPFVNHPYVFQFNNMADNIHQIPAVYNKTKDIEIQLQEEIYNVNITVNINCESQLQALNIHHLILNNNPVNKYLHLFEFISFHEIDTELLNKFLFDTNNDKLNNTFLKHNKFSNELDYCFSMLYNPLTKLNMSTIDISNISASSFQVSNSFTSLFHLPMYLIAPSINNSSNIFPDSKKIYYSNISVGTKEDLPYLLLEFEEEVHILPIFNNNFDINFIYGNIKGLVENINCYDVVLSYKDKLYKSSVVNNHLSGIDINGNLKNFEIKSNILDTWFSGVIDKQPVSDRLKFTIENSYINYKLNTVSSNVTKTITNFKIINNDFYNFIPRCNKYSNVLNKQNSSISNLLIIDDNKYVVIDIDPPVSCDSPTIKFKHKTINYSLEFEIKDKLYISDIGLNIVAVNFNKLEFDFIKGLHSGYIENINIDYSYNNEMISDVTPFRKFSELLYSNVNLILDHIDSDFDILTKKYSFVIHIKLKEIPKQWQFIYRSRIVRFDDPNIILDLDSSNLFSLRFIVNEKLYLEFFSHINKIHPLFFILT